MAKYEKYSKNFPRWEMLRSQTASRKGISNEPTEEHEENLKALAENVLQRVRDHFGIVNISSGYRSPELNAAIGGAPNSQHTKGEAADIELINPRVSNWELARWIQLNLSFDQLILEYPGPNPKDGWVHVSFKKNGDNRKEVLTKLPGRYVKGLVDKL